jgi:hypothetical protein
MEVTRRKLALTLAATAAIPTIAIAQPPSASDEETQSAHDLMRTNSQALAKVKLPMTTEPPFHFKA